VSPIQNTHPEDLKAAIRKSGVTLVGLSRELGYSDPAVGMALGRRWHEVRVGIAKHLGKSLHDLWPEDYFADDRPRAHRPRPKASDSARARRRQKTNRKIAA
jgi:lambda repressor-like predicted transcriptional regulator